MNNKELKNGIITEVQKSNYTVFCNKEYTPAQISGRFSYIATNSSDYPVVGDRVSFRMADQYKAIIERVDTRNSYISRISKSATKHEEILAANIDIAFICVSLNNDFNVKKIERLISLVTHPNITPILVLTKKDLVDDILPFLECIAHIDIKTIIISSFEDGDVEVVREIVKNHTCICVGASGVGKSTLINQLIGRKHFATSGIRESDAQGHHTTTHRELVFLENGGAIIDTPGIRVITRFLMDDLDGRFKSISEYSKKCRFRDCTHEHEPGCAVIEAIDNGDIDYSDYEEYKRMGRYNNFLLKRAKMKKKSK